LRDYLLYAADEDIVAVHWSPQILKDMADHLVANRPGFTEESARRLVDAMTDSYPAALVTPEAEDLARLAGHVLPDDDDRDVMATALTAEADIICTSNLKHFPKAVMDDLGLVAMTPDTLFVQLIDDYLPQMVAAHQAAVRYFKGATDDSTMTAIRKAGAVRTADRMAAALGLAEGSGGHGTADLRWERELERMRQGRGTCDPPLTRDEGHRR
jgi:predicted nucleic acid-binding protein